MNKGYVYFICLVSALGGLLFGYDWVVIGGAKPFYELYFSISDEPLMQGLAMSTALVGCLMGAMVAGAVADKYGRKPLLILAAVLFTLSAVATGWVSDFTLFNVARLLGGVGIGVASALSPLYIAEISPAAVRGKLVSLNQMTIVLGILAAQVVNWLLAEDIPLNYTAADILNSWNGQMGWRWMFWAEALPAAAFLALAFFIPESPRWQAINGMVDKATVTWTKISSQEYAQSQFDDISRTAADVKEEKARFSSLFKTGGVLFLGIFIAVFQQWCGTNVIFNYAQEIFTSAGYSVGDVLFNIVITGIANVIFTIVALGTVDRWGRRSLMLFGAGSLALIYLLLGLGYYLHVQGIAMVALVVLAIGCYAMSLGPVTWVLISELFPNRVRGLAVAVCTFFLWTACTVLTFTFPALNSALGSSGTFWIYSAICVIGFVFFVFRLPETKGKSLGEIEKMTKNN
ncbi:MAG: sugar porter family MFS transporter [Muribaculaceae bacterium]